ncbi:hypothetical protein [Paenibacillus tundrae]|uniref:hypothetical protein n=1 Tax=Paenibacillus tundrae TaxID=528187 RepID=UPI0022A96739|nr:hypothetical protein [Paenibacillus tundrae]MCZ1264258.1 hypothetical protein [Paenibacillus tundrae]
MTIKDKERDEEYFFELINRTHEFEIDKIANIKFHKDELPDKEIVSRITDKTFRSLGLKRVNSIKFSKQSLIARASILVLIMGSVLALSLSPEVIADLKKRLSFIPGLGIVQTVEQAEQQVYILEQPFEKKVGKSSQLINGIVISNKDVQISMAGIGGKPPKTVSLITDSGNNYSLQLALSNQTGESWQGSYYYIGQVKIKDDDDPSLMLRYDNNLIGPMMLKKANFTESIEELGPSTTKNGVLIASVIKLLENHRVRVNLLSDSPDTVKVNYGINSSSKFRLTDPQGNEIVMQNDSISDFYPNEILFEVNTNGPYTINIPELLVTDLSGIKQKVSLPVPVEGRIITEIPLMLEGLPFELVSVERKDNSTVSIEIDIYDNVENIKKLRNFNIVDINGNAVSYQTEIDESTLALKNLILTIDPSQEKLVLNVTEPTYLIKGPWTLKFNIPQDNALSH